MRNSFRVTDAMRSDKPLVAAKAYLSAGLKLVVIHGIGSNGKCTCRKNDCAHPGKHPVAKYFPNGALSATGELSTVSKAFKDYPDANFAAVLNGLTVVDIDGPRGNAVFTKIDTPATIKVKTSRGKHVYFSGKYPGGTAKGDQIDILTGANRYVMLPPSRHESGHRYRWLLTNVGESAPLPNSLSRLLPEDLPTKKPLHKKRGLIRKGERNDVMFRTACAIRRRVDDDRIVFEMMKGLNARGLEEPLPESELRGAIASSGRYGESVSDLFGPPVETKPLPMEYL